MYLPILFQTAPKVSHDICHLRPQVQKRYDDVTKISRNPLKIRFLFQTGDTIAIYVSIRRHLDSTTLQQYCATFGFAAGYTEVFQCGTISMSTGRNVDN